MNKIINYLTGRSQNIVNQNPVVENEESFYTELFTKSAYWSNPNPNTEEKLRWQVIKSFVFYILGYHAHANKNVQLKILDLGCGRGWLSNLLSTYGNVIGVEPIKPVVEYANKIFPALDIRHGTSELLLKSGEKFDLIVCSEVIEHVIDAEKLTFLNNLNLLLNPDGFLILTTPRKDVQNEWLKYSKPGQPIEDWLDEKTVGELVNDAGFIKHYLDRFAIPPVPDAPEIEIYQLWLVQKA